MEKTKKKSGKKILLIILFSLIAILILLMAIVNSSGTDAEKQAKADIKDSINYYYDTLTKDIPKLASDKKNDEITVKLEEAITRLDSDTQKYLTLMNDKTLPQETRDAAMNVKTCFHGISSTVLKPMLAIFKGESTAEVPEYSTVVLDAYEQYLKKALDLIK